MIQQKTEVCLLTNMRYEIHYGELSEQHIQELTPLRLELFYEYPYLYCGDPEREYHNWKRVPADSGVVVLAYDNTTLVGAILAYNEDAEKHVSLAQHPAYQPGKCLHLDIIMITKSHRRYGTARELMRRFEADAHKRGYTDVFGITVVRSKNHPLKPERPLDLPKIFMLGGFKPTGLYEAWNWPTRCGVPGDETVARIDNMIQFWHKRFV